VHSLQWGNVPTWLSSAGTILALSLSLMLYRMQLRDRRRANAERADTQAAQARTITAVVEKRDNTYPIMVTNHGSMPVTDVVFHTIRYRSDGPGQAELFPALDHPFVERAGDGGLLVCTVLGGGKSFVTADTSVTR
jgi:hypothetical protein